MTTPAQIERVQLARGNRATIAWRPAAPFDAGIYADSRRVGDSDFWNETTQQYQRGLHGLPRSTPGASETVPCASCGRPLSARYVKPGSFRPLCRTCARPAIAPEELSANQAALAEYAEKLAALKADRPVAPLAPAPEPARPRGDDAVLDAAVQTGPDARAIATTTYRGQRGRRMDRFSRRTPAFHFRFRFVLHVSASFHSEG